jgi:peptidoglycan/LPS O-acetylase OafA/YrhL
MTPDRRIPSLDGLRAISIIFVLVSHLAGTTYFPMSFDTANVLFLGDLGVHVFFVISGFLITGLLLDEQAHTGQIDIRRFYLRRTLRIFPPYYTLILMLLLAEAIGWVHLMPHDALHAATYTSNYQTGGSWYLGHAWSLSVEEQFYLLWPALILLAGTRRGIAIAAGVVLLSPFVRLASWEFARVGMTHRFETVADSIAVGCVLAGTRPFLHRQRGYMATLSSPLFVLVPIAALAANLLHGHPRTYFAAGLTIENVGLALCIDWCVTYAEGRIGRVLNTPPLVFVGVMSYSLYLWQQIFLNRESTAAVSTFPANIVLVMTGALASYYLIERPSLRFRRRLERLMGGPRAPSPASLSETLVPTAPTTVTSEPL